MNQLLEALELPVECPVFIPESQAEYAMKEPDNYARERLSRYGRFTIKRAQGDWHLDGRGYITGELDEAYYVQLDFSAPGPVRRFLADIRRREPMATESLTIDRK